MTDSPGALKSIDVKFDGTPIAMNKAGQLYEGQGTRNAVNKKFEGPVTGWTPI